MNKERLEEIKSVSEFQIDNDSYYGRPANVTLKGDDVKWLIEQAEIGINTSRGKQSLIKSNIALNKRVQELEEIKIDAIKIIDVSQRRSERLNKRVQELEKRIADDEHFVAEILEQNKRYREALELLVKQETLGKDVKTGKTAISYNGMIALKGLGIFNDNNYIVYGVDEIIENVLEGHE